MYTGKKEGLASNSAEKMLKWGGTFSIEHFAIDSRERSGLN
ncbi:hypothetical protein [Bacillus xiapuensis]|nr:hypothetical protein [Bacillus xiapuensis]